MNLTVQHAMVEAIRARLRASLEARTAADAHEVPIDATAMVKAILADFEERDWVICEGPQLGWTDGDDPPSLLWMDEGPHDSINRPLYVALDEPAVDTEATV